MCSYPHLQYHFDQYELDCRHRDTPREVHEQKFAGSSFAHHLLQSNTNSQALPLANDQPHALSLLPGTAQRYRLEVAFSWSFEPFIYSRLYYSDQARLPWRDAILHPIAALLIFKRPIQTVSNEI